MKQDCAYWVKNISPKKFFDAVLGKQRTSCSQTLFSSLKPFFKIKTQTLSLSLSLSHYGSISAPFLLHILKGLVCVWEGERENGCGCVCLRERENVCVCVCVKFVSCSLSLFYSQYIGLNPFPCNYWGIEKRASVCVWEKERERERESR